jgi:hypothetical protein
LHGVGQGPRARLAVSTAAIARDHPDIAMGLQPGFHGARLAIRQKGNHAPPGEVTDDRAVTVIAAQRPVVNADDLERVSVRSCVPAYGPKQRVLAHRHHQSARKALSGSAAQRQAEVMNEAVEPSGAASVGLDDPRSETLDKDAASASRGLAPKPACDEPKPNASPSTGKIASAPDVGL